MKTEEWFRRLPERGECTTLEVLERWKKEEEDLRAKLSFARGKIRMLRKALDVIAGQRWTSKEIYDAQQG